MQDGFTTDISLQIRMGESLLDRYPLLGVKGQRLGQEVDGERGSIGV